MNIHKPGSALLIIFFIINTMILVCWLVWRSTSLGVDLVIEKQQYEQQVQAFNALYCYAQLLVKNNYTAIIKNSLSKTIHFDHWPEKESRWSARVNIQPVQDRIESTCTLYNNNNLIASKTFVAFLQSDKEKSVLILKSYNET